MREALRVAGILAALGGFLILAPTLLAPFGVFPHHRHRLPARPLLDGAYFSFATGGDPTDVVDRYETRTSGQHVTFYRNGPAGSRAKVDSATALPMESYLLRKDELFSPTVQATVEPNGDLTWSHGYTSRREQDAVCSRYEDRGGPFAGRFCARCNAGFPWAVDLCLACGGICFEGCDASRPMDCVGRDAFRECHAACMATPAEAATPAAGSPPSTDPLSTELNHVARNTDNTARAESLVAVGADLASTNGARWRHTPLHQAAFFGRLAMARTLVALGAPLELPSNPCGRGGAGTPAELARGGGHDAVADLIEAAIARRKPGKPAADGKPGVAEVLVVQASAEAAAMDDPRYQSYSNTVMGRPPPDGITCESTAHCPTSGACAENPVCWTHESPNGHHYCAEQVTPGSSGTTTDICSNPAAQDYIQCWQGKAQRYCRHSYDYSNTVMGRPPPDAEVHDEEVYEAKEAAGRDKKEAEVSAPFKLAVDIEKGLVATLFGRFSGPDHTGRESRTWILHSLGVGDLAEATVFVAEGPKDNCIIRKVRDPDRVALEVDKRIFEHGTRIWLWNDAPAVPAESHSRFALHEDGRISPHPSTPGRKGDGDFVLGQASGQTLVLVPRGHPAELRLRTAAV